MSTKSSKKYTNTSRHLTFEERVRLFTDYLQEVPTKSLAKTYHISEGCCFNILRKAKKDNSPEFLKRKEYPKRESKFSERMKRKILDELKSPEGTSLRKVQKSLQGLALEVPSLGTISRIGKETGLVYIKKVSTPFITYNQKSERLKWANKYLGKQIEFWRKILWTDESPVYMLNNPGNRYVYCDKDLPENEKAKLRGIPIPKHSDYVMVWGCFSYYGLGKLVCIVRN